MKLVIDIPNEIYKICKTNDFFMYNESTTIRKSIANGTPLPKNHGRLIDADELIQDIKDDSQLCYFNSESERIIHDKMVDYAIDRIADAPTIILIESEKE